MSSTNGNGHRTWHMTPGIRTSVETVVEELIDTHGATQDEIKAFFATERIRGRMIADFLSQRSSSRVPTTFSEHLWRFLGLSSKRM